MVGGCVYLFVILSGAKRSRRTSNFREHLRGKNALTARQSKRSLDKLGMTTRNFLSLRERTEVRVNRIGRRRYHTRANHPARDARCGVRDNIADSMVNRLTLILTFSLREKESLRIS
jgi:hypothetical protein